MKTLIVYSSKYGATKECAERIAMKLPGETALGNLDSGGLVDLSAYDHVVIGCSVYMGKPRKAARSFSKKYLKTLLDKRVGLFLCCIQDIEKNVRQQFEAGFPRELLAHAVAMEQLGGVVDFTKLKALDKPVMNMVAGDLRKKTGGNVISTLSDDRIAAFCKQLTQGQPNDHTRKQE